MPQNEIPPILVLSREAEALRKLRQAGCATSSLALATTPARARRIMRRHDPQWIVQTPNTLHWLPATTQRDPLTGLLNRETFLNKLSNILQNGEPSAALIVFSLDRFCRLNEIHGIEKGDEILIALAQRLECILRKGDVCARLGNDHFALLVRNLRMPQSQHLEMLAQRFFDGLTQPLKIDGHHFHLNISMGIAGWPHDGKKPDGRASVEILFNAADAARKQAARRGGNQFVFFRPNFIADVSRRVQLEDHLRYALARNEIEVWYQPQIHAADGSLAGAEALIRWRHPKLGMISPAEFVPIAEQTGLIQEISLFALDQVLSDVALLAQRNRPLHFGINLSPRQFLYDDLLEQIAERLHDSLAPAEWIEFEITESQAMTHLETAVETMQALKNLGTRLALDDFGTGYSSLSWLAQFPIDTLKIDQSFVRHMEKDKNFQALVRAIAALGKSLGCRLVAEGVETNWQRTFLKDAGVDVLQGFLFGEAKPAETFIARHIESS